MFLTAEQFRFVHLTMDLQAFSVRISICFAGLMISELLCTWTWMALVCLLLFVTCEWYIINLYFSLL